MQIKNGLIILIVMLIASQIAISRAQTTPSIQASYPPILINDQLVWLDAQHIMQAKRTGQQARSIITRDVPISALSATEHYLAWIEHQVSSTIVIYDRKAQTIIAQQSYPYSPQLRIALAQNTLWLSGISGQAGLYAWPLDQAQAQIQYPHGQDPIVASGIMLWSEKHSLGNGQNEWQLWAKTEQQSMLITQQIAQDYAFNSYHSDGQRIVWTFDSSIGDPNIHQYDLQSQQYSLTPAELGAQALLTPQGLLWAAYSPQQQWQLFLQEATSARPFQASPTKPQISAADQQGIVLSYETGDPNAPYQIVLLDWQASRARQAITPAQASTCRHSATSNCGQLRVQGNQLADSIGPSQINGVQFFLPQYGINDRTLRTANYQQAKTDGSLDYWLDKSANYLQANLLRIFVELPYQSNGNTITPTDHETLYDFAQQAKQRGMRLGISLHNSANWTMQAEQEAWLRGMLNYFAERNDLATIAYLSADNEINNHCSRSGVDCFDSNSSYNAQSYIDGAIAWVSSFRQVVKSQAPSMPITVGISTEMQDVDNTRGAFNFMRPASNQSTLASLVDFVSPHNYGGGAAGILQDIRYAGYTGPILLEEYGFPTDPVNKNPLWNEGPMICRAQPLQAACHNTAPYYIEQNILAMQSHSYSGGVSWMLSDMQEKNGSNVCNSRPSDLWTGLFAIGGNYCGGTNSQQFGEAKATAVRVCLYYSAGQGLCNADLYLPEVRYLPIISKMR